MNLLCRLGRTIPQRRGVPLLRSFLASETRVFSAFPTYSSVRTGGMAYNISGFSGFPYAIFQEKRPYCSSRPTLTPSEKDENLRSPTASKEEGDEKGGEEKKGKLRVLWDRYGRIALYTYGGVYVSTLFTIFGLYESGLLVQGPETFLGETAMDEETLGAIGDALDSATQETATQHDNVYMQVFHKFGLEKYIDPEKLSPTQGNFLLAWLTTKVTEPARALATAMLTPPIARYFGYAPKRVKKGSKAETA